MTNPAENNPQLEQMQRRLLVGRVFTPTAPIDEASLFAGRVAQVGRIFETISQKGQHAVIYGERGVGKTSLTNVLKGLLNIPNTNIIVAKATSDTVDTYSTLWRKVFGEIPYSLEEITAGFSPKKTVSVKALSDFLPEIIEPNLVRRMLTQIGQQSLLIVVIDEFDRLSKEVSNQMADTIKALSDHATPVTVVLVGVADTVNQLIENHQSVERALVQIPMPRMSKEEIKEVINKGLSLLQLSIEDEALNRTVLLSQGLPHFAHLIALHSSTCALDNNKQSIGTSEVDYAISKAVENTQMSIRTSYNNAVSSPRPDNLYAEVLLACALADSDEMGFFQASAVKEPMSELMGRRYEINSFARHLRDFCDNSRGPILERTGTERRFRYRFINPLVQPYIIMRGIAEGLLTRDRLAQYYSLAD